MAMNQISLLRARFARGEVSLEDLPLHLEPLLWEARKTARDEASIRTLMNDLELIIFTFKQDQQHAAAEQLLVAAESFLEAREDGPGTES